MENASKLSAELKNDIGILSALLKNMPTRGKPKNTIDILKLIVQAYSDQWYPYSFLADFQLQVGHKDEAIKNYKKSLELNPDNEQAIQQLQKLEHRQ